MSREAMQQEPVAWIHNFIEGGISIGKKPTDLNRHPDRWTALYKDPTPCKTCQALAMAVMNDQTYHEKVTPKREWVGLTKEDMPDGDNPMFDTNEFYAGMSAWHGWVLREVLFDNGELIGHREPEQKPVAWTAMAFARLGEVRDKMRPDDVRIVQQFLDGDYTALEQTLEEKQEPRPCKVGSACVPTENGSCACSQLTPSTNSVVTQTEQEPVAWRSTSPDGKLSNKFACKPTEGNWVEPLYTAPQPAQKPLIPSMEEAVAAGDAVLMNEQASLLRECRAALDSLIAQKPSLTGLLCGSTTLGNLKASLHAYRPQSVFGLAHNIKEKNT